MLHAFALLLALSCTDVVAPASAAAPSAAAPSAAAPSAAAPSAAAPAVLTGGQPSEAELARHAAAGVRRVIDLRGPTEPRGMDEAAVVTALGMEYVALPVVGAADLSPDNARRLSQLIADAQGPVLVHCASGNRVGALLALEAFHVDGLDAEAAMDAGRAGGLSGLEATVRQLLAR